MLKLRFTNSPLKAVWLVEPNFTIGRAATNNLVLDDTSVAAKHAEIVVVHEHLTIRNISEGQGVKVNGEAVQESQDIAPGDLIGIGSVELQVVDPKSESRPEAPTAAKASASSPSGWALKANHSALSNRVFSLVGQNTVGRSNECDITLAAAHLSRRHAQLSVRGGQLFVADLGSSNGTFVNGERVTESRLKRGDELRFDTLSFGVIGPADEMDKTSVRSISPALAAAQRPAAARPATASAKKTERPVTVAAAKPVTATKTEEPATKSATMKWVLLAVVLVCSGGAILAMAGGAL